MDTSKVYTYIIDMNDEYTKHQPIFEISGCFNLAGDAIIHSFILASDDWKVRGMELTDYLASGTIDDLTFAFMEAHQKAIDSEEITPEEVNNIKADMEYDRRRDEA
jgi:hypothetical protein